MFSRLYNILTEIMGESKQGYYSSDCFQYQFNCPCCTEENDGLPDDKYNLEVSFQVFKFKCWKCADTHETHGNIVRLVKKYGTVDQYKRFKEEIASIKNSSMYDIDLYSGVTFSNIVEENTIKLPSSFKKIDLEKCPIKEVIDYCKKRCLTQKIINKFYIGYTSNFDKDYTMRNRIIIPSYDKYGDLNYFVGRDYTENQKVIKYKNCDADKKTILFQENHINFDADIYLVEGAIDTLYLPNTISLLGKTLSRDSYLFKTLSEKSNAKIIIVLDNDTTINEVKKIYRLLNDTRKENSIYYIRMEKYKDFGELFENNNKKCIFDILKNVQQFSEIELL